MKKSFLIFLAFVLMAFSVTACAKKEETPETTAETTAVQQTEAAVNETEAAPEDIEEPALNAEWKVGVGAVDITPDEPVQTVGGVAAVDVTEQDTPLMVKAAVIEAGDDKAVIITIDSLKYPYHEEAVRKVAELGFDKENILISASHTHSAPYYTYYFDNLENEIVEAVKLAMKDLETVTLGAASTKVSGVSDNRRLIDADGSAWNNWFVPDSIRSTCTNPGPVDEEMVLLTAKKADGKIKAVIWNFADHPCSYSEAKLSADFPGHVQENVNDLLGYDAVTLFINGAAGDINPTASTDTISDKMAAALVEAAKSSESIEKAKIVGFQEKLVINDREVEFAEEEIAKKWPDQLEGYRSNYENTKKKDRSNDVYVSAVAFGEGLVIAAEPGELFCQYGLDVKESSSFPYTMIAEATNGFMGYIPTPEDFEEGGYETWYGEHSFLDEGAGDQIAKTMKSLVKKAAKEQGVSGLVSGLKMELHKLVDTTNVIVKFNKEAYGCTDKVNFAVTDANGKQYEVSAVTSAFAELGGEVPNVFKISFAKELPEGEYTVKASNLFANTSDTSPVYKACETTFTIGQGTAKGKAVSGDIEVSFIKTPNNKNVIIRFSEPVDGCTDTENYKIVDRSGKAYTITSAVSAFAELGGEIPDVFKITTSEKMPDGAYTMTITGLTGSSGPVGDLELNFNMGGAAGSKADLQAMIAASFPSTTATMGLVKVVDKANVIVVYSTPLEGCTEANQYMIVDEAGISWSIRSAKSAFAELGGEMPNVFRITTEEELPVGKYTVYSFGMLKGTTPVGYMTAQFEITTKTAAAKTGPLKLTAELFKYIDRSNIIIKFSEEAGGFTDPANYTLVGSNGLTYKPKEVTSAFQRIGGTDANVFNMNFVPGLPNGKYVLTIAGITDGAFECEPIVLSFSVPGSTGEFLLVNGSGSGGSGGGGTKAKLTGLGFELIGTPTEESLIVKFDRAVNGSTETSNYKIIDSDGKKTTPKTAVSAFQEIQVPNSFKLTYSELKPGTYTLVCSNQTVSKGTYEDVSVQFTLKDTTKEPSTAWMKFSQPLPDGNYSLTLSNLKDGDTTLDPIKVNFAIGDVSKQGLSRQGEDPDPLEVTAEVIDSSNILIKFSRSPKGVKKIENYAFVNEDTKDPVPAPAMKQVEAEVLKMGVYKVVDNKNVIVRFNMDMNGATENGNYVVRNEAGDTMAISKVASAFQELGGEATNVFKITFVNELPEGKYSVLAQNLSKDGSVLAPISKEFEIGGTGSGKIKGLTLKVHEVAADRKSIVVQFNKAADGATDAGNYIVKNSQGQTFEVTSASSAYVEYDCKYPNIFRLSFANALPDGTYKIYAKNQFDNELMKTYVTVSCSVKLGDVEDVYMVGVGDADITPTENVPLAGDTSSTDSTGKDTNLYVKAMIVDSGLDRVVFVTIDTLKFPEQGVAIQTVAELAGVPEENVYITASHTHSAPIYSYYYDNFVESITEAVEEALEDMEECDLAVASAQTSGLTQNRRYLDNDGQVWNEWFAPSEIKALNNKTGPEDEEIEILAAIDGDDNYKAILWNYACHACSNLTSTISADYPGHVQSKVNELLGYDTMTLYMTGAAGDVNPDLSKTSMTGMGNTIGSAIVTALGSKSVIENVAISSGKSTVTVAKRDATFAETEITKVWPTQVEHYRKEFNTMKAAEKATYSLPVSAVSIGGVFVLSSNSAEMFCGTGKNIKTITPVDHVMITEATNGFSGYIPTEEDYEHGGYETWYGTHSYLEEEADEKLRVACIAEISNVTGITIDPDTKTDLEMNFFGIEDDKTILVRFNKEVDGCTTADNYAVTDKDGNSIKVTEAATGWWDYSVPNTFRLKLETAMPEGKITVSAKNMYKNTDHYAPASMEVHLLPLTVHSVPDNQNVLVKFSKEVIGCTTASNYVVLDSDHKAVTVASAVNAFNDQDPTTVNTFKLTFGSELAAGKYTVYAKGITDSDGNRFTTKAAEFTIESPLVTGLTMEIVAVEDNRNIVVAFNDSNGQGYTEKDYYTVSDGSNTYNAASVASAFAKYEIANCFRITMASELAPGEYTLKESGVTTSESLKYSDVSAEFGVNGISPVDLPDSKTLIVKITGDVLGLDETSKYTVKNTDGDVQTVSSVASNFDPDNAEATAGTFRLTFANDLSADSYTVELAGCIKLGGKKFSPAKCEFDYNLAYGLTMELVAVEDDQNIVVAFSDNDGQLYTEAVFYKVVDAEGNAVSASAINSAFQTYQIGNCFRVTLSSKLAPGEYTLKERGVRNGSGKTYKAASAEFGVNGISTFKVEDSKNVVVKVTGDVLDLNQPSKYTVKNSGGTAQTISAVESAQDPEIAETNGTFRLTFADDLATDVYTVELASCIKLGGKKFSPASCEFETPATGLTMEIIAVEDNRNIVVAFNDSNGQGYTEKDYYTVSDGSNTYNAASVESAFAKYEIANCFRITMASELAPGEYTISEHGVKNAAGRTYVAVSAEFGVNGISPVDLPDSKTLIVKITGDVLGLDETSKYTVKNSNEEAQTISSVASNFDPDNAEATAGTFRLTFANDLSADTYTVELAGCIKLGGKKFSPASCEIEVKATGLTMEIVSIEDNKNIVVAFNDSNGQGYTEKEFYQVSDGNGNTFDAEKVESAYQQYGIANCFRITLESELEPGEYTLKESGVLNENGKKYVDVSVGFGVLTVSVVTVEDAKNVVIKPSAEVLDLCNPEKYTVKNTDGDAQTISTIASAYEDGKPETVGTFRITFAADLSADTYEIEMNNFIVEGGKKYSNASSEFDYGVAYGLTMELIAVEDDQNIVVAFNDNAGQLYTEAVFYKVVDAEGNVVSASAVESAFVKYQIGNCFRVTLSSELAPGEYTLKERGVRTGSGQPYKRQSAEFGVLGVSTVDVPDNSSVIIKVEGDVLDLTDASKYVVKNSDSEAQTVSQVTSNFDPDNAEATAGTFKLSFANELEADTYTVEMSGFIKLGGKKFSPASCEFEVSAPKLQQLQKSTIEVQSEHDSEGEEPEESETEIPDNDEEGEQQETANIPAEIKTDKSDDEEETETDAIDAEKEETEQPEVTGHPAETEEKLPELEEL